MNTRLEDILGKELSRRDFLKVIAGSLLLVMGAQNLISYIANFKPTEARPARDTAAHGFGSSKFGR